MKFPAPLIATRPPISRRRFLQGTGVALALPLLEAMLPGTVRAAGATPAASGVPRRMFGICNNLGLRPDLFFPAGTGREYVVSPYLKLLESHREQFTVISGVSHPNVDGGHPSDISFLTAAAHPCAPTWSASPKGTTRPATSRSCALVPPPPAPGTESGIGASGNAVSVCCASPAAAFAANASAA